MSSTSFPTFASFPDLEPGPSTRPSAPPEHTGYERRKSRKATREGGVQEDVDERKNHKYERRRRREEGGRAHRGKRSRSRSVPRPHRESRKDVYEIGEDERRKLEQDRSRKREVEQPSAKEGLVYFADRKGDPLNVRYGGLHSGDVPKYRLVGGK